MMLPTNIRQKSGELFPNDLEKQKIFCMGAAFSLGKDLSDFEKKGSKRSSILARKLSICGLHTRKKNVKYQPRGLAALKKKLLKMSNGNPEYAKVIVEHSMGNNY